MAQAGYTKVVSIKTTGAVSYGALPGNTASLNFGAESLDDTDFTSTGWRSRIRGLKDYSVSITALWDSGSTALAVVRSALLSGATLDFKYLPNGTKGFAGQAVVENMTHSGDVGGLESVDMSLVATAMTALTTV